MLRNDNNVSVGFPKEWKKRGSETLTAQVTSVCVPSACFVHLLHSPVKAFLLLALPLPPSVLSFAFRALVSPVGSLALSGLALGPRRRKVWVLMPAGRGTEISEELIREERLKEPLQRSSGVKEELKRGGDGVFL